MIDKISYMIIGLFVAIISYFVNIKKFALFQIIGIVMFLYGLVGMIKALRSQAIKESKSNEQPAAQKPVNFDDVKKGHEFLRQRGALAKKQSKAL